MNILNQSQHEDAPADPQSDSGSEKKTDAVKPVDPESESKSDSDLGLNLGSDPKSASALDSKSGAVAPADKTADPQSDSDLESGVFAATEAEMESVHSAVDPSMRDDKPANPQLESDAVNPVFAVKPADSESKSGVDSPADNAVDSVKVAPKKTAAEVEQSKNAVEVVRVADLAAQREKQLNALKQREQKRAAESARLAKLRASVFFKSSEFSASGEDFETKKEVSKDSTDDLTESAEPAEYNLGAGTGDKVFADSNSAISVLHQIPDATSSSQSLASKLFKDKSSKTIYNEILRSRQEQQSRLQQSAASSPVTGNPLVAKLFDSPRSEQYSPEDVLASLKAQREQNQDQPNNFVKSFLSGPSPFERMPSDKSSSMSATELSDIASEPADVAEPLPDPQSVLSTHSEGTSGGATPPPANIPVLSSHYIDSDLVSDADSDSEVFLSVEESEDDSDFDSDEPSDSASPHTNQR